MMLSLKHEFDLFMLENDHVLYAWLCLNMVIALEDKEREILKQVLKRQHISQSYFLADFNIVHKFIISLSLFLSLSLNISIESVGF